MSQNLQNFAKFQKFQLENLVDFEKCCKTHIFLQKSEPIQPNTSNLLPKFANRRSLTSPPWPGGCSPARARPGTTRSGSGTAAGRATRPGKIGKISQNFCKLLAGSFSALSKRNFARKYAFDSIFQALQDLHPVAPLQSQIFRKKIGLKKQQFS